MTLLELLRQLASAGVGLKRRGDRLRTSRTVEPNVRAAIVAHKGAFMALFADDDAALRAAFSIPAAQVLSPAIRTVLLWLHTERDAFTTAERELYAECAAVRDADGGAPRWLAEAMAVEDVCRQRSPPALPHLRTCAHRTSCRVIRVTAQP